MKKHIRKSLTENVHVVVTCQSKRLSSKFKVIDKRQFYHQSNLVYYRKCPNQTCTKDYIGETDRKIRERIINHNKRDKSLHILKHSREEGRTHVRDKDFRLLGNNYHSAFKRKISEALFMKQLKPSLNVKKKSMRLHLYN